MLPRERWQIAQRIFATGSSRFLRFSRWVALGSVALSSAALLVTLAVLDGFEQQLEQKAALFIANIDVRAMARIPLADAPRWMDALRTLSADIRELSAYTELEAVLQHRRNVEAALIRADTPSVQLRTAQLGLDAAALRDGLALGRPLAERLGVRSGDTLVVFVPTASTASIGSARIAKVPVVAIYESGMRMFDESVVFTSPRLLERLSFRTDISGFSLWLGRSHTSSELARRIASAYSSTLLARTAQEIHPAMFTWIALQKRPIPIVVGILSIVAAFNILTLLFVAIVERSRTIATLRLLGLRRRDLVAMVASYSGSVGTAGFVAGLLLAAVFCRAQQQWGLVRLDAEVYFIDRLPIALEWWHIGAVGAVVVVLTLLVTVVPALAATRISPLALLRIR